MVDANGNTEITPVLIHLQLNKEINESGKGFQIIFDNRTSDFSPNWNFPVFRVQSISSFLRAMVLSRVRLSSPLAVLPIWVTTESNF
jgi:hypothetical protein